MKGTAGLPVFFRPRLHEQIKPPLIAQIPDPSEVTPGGFAQIKDDLFAHVNVALTNIAHVLSTSGLVSPIEPNTI